MHSSRMRTGRSLTVFRSLQPGGVYLVPGGGCTWSLGGTWSGGGVYLVPEGCTWSQGGTWSWGGTWSQGGVPGLGGCTWSRRGVPDPGGGTWSRGDVPGPGGCTSSGGVPGRGVYLVPMGCTWSRGGVPGPGGCTWSGGGGGVYLVRYSPPVNRMTNRCKNITLAKTSFRPVINSFELTAQHTVLNGWK